MSNNIKKFTDKVYQIPFTCRTETPYKLWEMFCRHAVIARYNFISIPVFLRVVIGLPMLLWGILPFMTYLIYVIWGYWLDRHIRYSYSRKNFSMKEFFQTNLRKLFLFIITAIFIVTFANKPLSWICSLYAFTMSLIAAGYTIPLFDKIIYDIDETD